VAHASRLELRREYFPVTARSEDVSELGEGEYGFVGGERGATSR